MFDRGTSDRRAERGVSRDIGEPGTAFSEATRLDELWWVGTAIQIFSRLPRRPGCRRGLDARAERRARTAAHVVRLAGRALEGNVEDPDIEKKIVIEGARRGPSFRASDMAAGSKPAAAPASRPAATSEQRLAALRLGGIYWHLRAHGNGWWGQQQLSFGPAGREGSDGDAASSPHHPFRQFWDGTRRPSDEDRDIDRKVVIEGVPAVTAETDNG